LCWDCCRRRCRGRRDENNCCDHSGNDPIISFHPSHAILYFCALDHQNTAIERRCTVTHVPPASFEGAGGDGDGWPMRSQQNPIPSKARRHSRIGIHISEEQTTNSVSSHVTRGTIRRVLGPSGLEGTTNGRSKGGVHEDACKSKIEESEEGSHSKGVERC
jgi:hypothetical protein